MAVLAAEMIMDITEPPLAVINKFNRGEVDECVLARDDVARITNSAAFVENWLPLRLGGMVHAPGVEDLAPMKAEGVMLPFVFAIDDTALVEVTQGCFRAWVDDEVIERTAVTAVIPDLSTWTNASGAGSAVTNNGRTLTAADTTEARIEQTVNIVEQNVEHGLRVEIERGPVRFQIGDQGNGSSNIFDGTLGTGVHSLSVTTDQSQLSLTFRSDRRHQIIIGSVAFEAAGIMEIPGEINDPFSIRWYQTADVLYAAQDGPQFIIQRRGKRSWSWVRYEADDGPFGFINSSQTTMRVSALNGDPAITASMDYFVPDMVGSLMRLASTSQTRTATVTAQGTGTGSIRVTGVDAARRFQITISGNFTGDINLQRSADDASWAFVRRFDVPQSFTFDDELDNSVTFYRLQVTDPAFSGTATLTLTYDSGTIEGIGRITDYISPTQVRVSALQEFGSTDETLDWYRSTWSNHDGFPTAVIIEEGRLFWAGHGELHGSQPALYQSFDRELEGNSRAILRTIGFGPIDRIHWLAAAVRLVMGLTSDEISVRSSSFGELLTQDNAVLRPGTMEGAAPVPPGLMNNDLYFADRSERKLIEMTYNVSNDSYSPSDLTYLAENICESGIRRIAVLKKPEPRILIVLNDGTARILLIDRNEDVLAWSRRTFPYPCEDVVVLPEVDEDRAYFVLNVNGTRRLQKMARIREASQYPVDMFRQDVADLAHLEGEAVDVWVNGSRVSEDEIVSGGAVGPQTGTVIVGKKITARWRSGRLGQYVDNSVLSRRKAINRLAVIIRDLWHPGFYMGREEQTVFNLPRVYKGAELDVSQMIEEYDTPPDEFDGSHETDSRIWFIADGPAKIVSLGYSIDEIDHQSRNAA